MFFYVKTLPLAMQFHFLIKFTTNSQISFWIKLKYNFDFSVLTLKLAWLSVKAGMGKWGTEWGEWGGGGNGGGNAENIGGNAGNEGGNARNARNVGYWVGMQGIWVRMRGSGWKCGK